MNRFLRKFAWLALLLGVMAGSAGNAHAGSLFWAVNNFATAQQINGDTGAVVQSFSIAGGSIASIAVVGNTGYYTRLGDANVYKVDMTTHILGGIAFNTGNAASMNSITVTADGHLWFGHGGSGAGNVLQEFTTAGVLVSTHAFPTAASSFRDGLAVFNGYVVANRGDQQGPYDKYSIGANNTTLTYVNQPFIVNGSGNNGIGFNGVNFYVANETNHTVSKFDLNGNFISTANLDPSSRYENWTFAAEDIVAGVPEPGSLTLLGLGIAGIAGYGWRRRRQPVAPVA
jgi:hypothetical protein